MKVMGVIDRGTKNIGDKGIRGHIIKNHKNLTHNH